MKRIPNISSSGKKLGHTDKQPRNFLKNAKGSYQIISGKAEKFSYQRGSL